MCVSVQFSTERTVLVPVSVPGKRFWRFRFHVRLLGKRFRRFRFPVPVRFLGHSAFFLGPVTLRTVKWREDPFATPNPRIPQRDPGNSHSLLSDEVNKAVVVVSEERRKASSSVPEGGAKFPAAIFLAGKCQTMTGIAFRAAEKYFPAVSKLAREPFQQ